MPQDQYLKNEETKSMKLTLPLGLYQDLKISAQKSGLPVASYVRELIYLAFQDGYQTNYNLAGIATRLIDADTKAKYTHAEQGDVLDESSEISLSQILSQRINVDEQGLGENGGEVGARSEYEGQIGDEADLNHGQALDGYEDEYFDDLAAKNKKVNINAENSTFNITIKL